MDRVHKESPIIHNNTAGVKVCRCKKKKKKKKTRFRSLKDSGGTNCESRRSKSLQSLQYWWRQP